MNPHIVNMLAFLLVASCPLVFGETHRPNVLMVFVDDLRPALGCYGDSLAKSPNMDRFATSARLFRRAYCNQAVCGPSRVSILTGRLPDNTRVWHNRDLFRNAYPGLVTLPQWFKQQGWHTVGLGKVFSGNARELDPKSWSEPEILTKKGWQNYFLRKPGGPKKGASFEMADVPDDGYTDGKLATLAIEKLKAFKQRPQPFFLAVGFFKPHLPFNAPKKYWDMYDPSLFHWAAESDQTRGAPEWAYSKQMELGGYQGVPKNERVKSEQAQKLRHGYYACVSYVDAQVGRLLEALELLGLEKDTIVVLLGDHGYSLGEAGHWCKKTNFELDTHVPLILRHPGMKRPGVPTDAMVEYVDLYPTLNELAGLPSSNELDGRSFAAAVMDPKASGRDLVLSQHSRPWSAGHPDVMGYSIRTETQRYTRWIQWKEKQTLAEELYDYGTPASVRSQIGNFVEHSNLINDRDYMETRETLSLLMNQTLTNRSEAFHANDSID